MSCIHVTRSNKIANKYYIWLQVLLKRNEVLYLGMEVLFKIMSCINVTLSIKIANKYYICLQVF